MHPSVTQRARNADGRGILAVAVPVRPPVSRPGGTATTPPDAVKNHSLGVVPRLRDTLDQKDEGAIRASSLGL